jgi:3-hydroxybutyryl-CoA dehydrogenase
MSNGKTLPKAVAVIGAGTMGNGIAQVFATAGVPTYLVDVQQSFLDRGLATIDKSLQKTADRTLPAPAILASNTSSISITVLAARTGRADRVIGMHFMNPVPLMKLVEVIRGNDTSDSTVHAIEGYTRALAKTPVLANDYPGFVANRILMPMINEAAFALMEGVATREAIDEIMKLGMNHPMGPLALADFIGLDVCVAILDVLHGGLGDDKYRACPLLRRLVHAGHLGRKSGRGFYDYRQGK